MANMSYCRFRNTLADLYDCFDALDNGALEDEEMDDKEKEACRQLVATCGQIAHIFEGDL